MKGSPDSEGGDPLLCGAKTRSGAPCGRLPVIGRRRCRLHGGLSPGAPGGEANGNYKNGDWTREAIQERRWLRNVLKEYGSWGET
jgi:hypothetical protein